MTAKDARNIRDNYLNNNGFKEIPFDVIEQKITASAETGNSLAILAYSEKDGFVSEENMMLLRHRGFVVETFGAIEGSIVVRWN